MAREAVRAAACAVVLVGCADDVPSVRVEKRVPLRLSDAERVAFLPDGHLLLSAPGVLAVVDTLGAEQRRMEAPGAAVRLLRADSARLLVTRGDREVLAIRLDSGAVAARRRGPRPAPAAADPRGRWVYTTHAWGSVLGLDSLLTPRWGWPDVGARGTALAVGSLADRVYLGYAEGETVGPGIHVLDAFTGRVMSVWQGERMPMGLAAGADPSLLYAWDDDGVIALRHVRDGLVQLWRAGLGSLDMDSVTAVRPSPAGDRVAVLGRSEGAGRLVLLSAASGRDTARWNGSPPDVAWDGRGRLVLLEEAELVWIR